MTKILMVIAFKQFRDEELVHPMQVFEAGGAVVDVASTETGVAEGMMGLKRDVTLTLDDVAGKTYDAVVVVGGGGSPEFLWDNVRLKEIVTRHHGMGRVVAAICLSSVVLAKAGLLKGVPATVWQSPESMKVFDECGVSFQNSPVVSSGKIVTGNGPTAAREFGEAVIKAVA